MGRGLQRADQTVPDPRLQRVPEEPATPQQALRIPRGQHPSAGGRVAVSTRSNTSCVHTSCFTGRGGVSHFLFHLVFQRDQVSRCDLSQVTCLPETSWPVWPTECLTALSTSVTVLTHCTHLNREYTCDPPHLCVIDTHHHMWSPSSQ